MSKTIAQEMKEDQKSYDKLVCPFGSIRQHFLRQNHVVFEKFITIDFRSIAPARTFIHIGMTHG